MGVVGTVSIHARQVKAPAGYVIAEVDVHDPATFQQYAKQVPGTVEKYNGHYIVRGGQIKAIEGEAPKRFVVIAFDSMEKAEAWEDSPEYSAIKPIRHKSATSVVFIAEGVPAQ
jgi:uncharacterized protein (DUF1330 family)